MQDARMNRHCEQGLGFKQIGIITKEKRENGFLADDIRVFQVNMDIQKGIRIGMKGICIFMSPGVVDTRAYLEI